MVDPILRLPIPDGNWLLGVCLHCFHKCHYLRLGPEQYSRRKARTSDKQLQAYSACHLNRSRAVHNCTFLKEGTEVECETTEVLCQSPRVGSISIIGTRASREVSDALARRGAASSPEYNSVTVRPSRVASIA